MFRSFRSTAFGTALKIVKRLLAFFLSCAEATDRASFKAHESDSSLSKSSNHCLALGISLTISHTECSRILRIPDIRTVTMVFDDALLGTNA